MMASLRESIGNAIERVFGPTPGQIREREQLREVVSTLWNAYQEGPFLLPPEQLLGQLKEVDPGYLEDALNDLLYERASMSGYSSNTEKERGRAVDESRRLYRVDVLTQWIVHLWTDFGFGQAPQITPVDEDALDAWNAFWESDANAPVLSTDRLYRLSEDLLVDGERFMVYFISTVDGSVIVREIDTKEIAEIVTDPDDSLTPLYYKRVYTDRNQVQQEVYYPDFLAAMNKSDERLVTDRNGQTVTVRSLVLPQGAKVASEVNESTFVVVQHIAHNNKGDLRGWPLMAAAAPWSRAHKKFREDRASIAAAASMFVAQARVKGGSRAVDAIRAKLNSTLSSTNYTDRNPAAPVGSTLTTNEAVDYSKLPLTTGAGDAQTDGNSLLMMAGLGGGVYPHWLGAGEAFRLATASAMETPMYREFTRYQNFWSAQFGKMARIVLWSAEEWGGEGKFETYAVTVSTDKLLEEDFSSTMNALGQMFTMLYYPGVTAGLIPDEPARKIMVEVWRLILTSLDVPEVNKFINDDAFAPGEPEGTPAEQPEGGPPEGEPEGTPDVAGEVAKLTASLREAMKLVGKNGRH